MTCKMSFLGVYLFIISLLLSLSLTSVSLSLTALLAERLLALLSPVFYAHCLKLGISIFTFVDSLAVAALVGTITMTLEWPSKFSPNCRDLGCLLPRTRAFPVLSAKFCVCLVNLLLALAVYATMWRVSRSRPSYFRRVSNKRKVDKVEASFQANRIALYAAATEIFAVFVPLLTIAFALFTGNAPILGRITLCIRILVAIGSLITAIIYLVVVYKPSQTTDTVVQPSSHLTAIVSLDKRSNDCSHVFQSDCKLLSNMTRMLIDFIRAIRFWLDLVCAAANFAHKLRALNQHLN